MINFDRHNASERQNLSDPLFFEKCIQKYIIELVQEYITELTEMVLVVTCEYFVTLALLRIMRHYSFVVEDYEVFSISN